MKANQEQFAFSSLSKEVRTYLLRNEADMETFTFLTSKTRGVRAPVLNLLEHMKDENLKNPIDSEFRRKENFEQQRKLRAKELRARRKILIQDSENLISPDLLIDDQDFEGYDQVLNDSLSHHERQLEDCKGKLLKINLLINEYDDRNSNGVRISHRKRAALLRMREQYSTRVQEVNQRYQNVQ